MHQGVINRLKNNLSNTQIMAIENIVNNNPTIYGCSFTIPIGWSFMTDNDDYKSLLLDKENVTIVNSNFTGEKVTKTLIDGRPVPMFNITQTYEKGL